MHIAICDDNVADRKQSERLLKRESEKRIGTTGALYVDSYGNAQAILHNPMMYDAFFLDLCHTEGSFCVELVEELVTRGVTAPIVLCLSEIDYRKETFSDRARQQVLYLEKPIRQNELSSVLDNLQDILSKIIPHIEIREEFETHYVEEEEIICAEELGSFTHIFLTEDRRYTIHDTAYTFFSEITGAHEMMLMPSLRTIVNCRHISKLGAFGFITMDNGKRFRLPKEELSYAKTMMEKYQC